MWFLVVVTIIGIFTGEWDIVIGMWIVSGILTLGSIVFNKIKNALSKD